MEIASVLKCQNCDYKISKLSSALILNINFNDLQRKQILEKKQIDFKEII